MGNKKCEGICKICCCPVKKGKGLRCCGACRCWYHFKCLNYSKKKIKAIKCGILKIECPCPDCCSVDAGPPDPLDHPPCSNRPCCCKKKCRTPCEIPNLDDDDCVIEIVCKNPCEMLMDGSPCPSPCPRKRPPPRPRYQSVKIKDDDEHSLPYCESSRSSRSEASVEMDARIRKPCCPRKICFPEVPSPTKLKVISRVPSGESRLPQDWRDRCPPPKPKLLHSPQSSREELRNPCQEWRNRFCPPKPPHSAEPAEAEQDWRMKPQPMPILTKVPSREQVRGQERRERRSQMSQRQYESSGQDWRNSCCPKPKAPDPPCPSPPQRTPCQEWRDRCCPKQKPPEPPPPPPPQDPCQDWRDRCCPTSTQQEMPPPRNPCQDLRNRCCPSNDDQTNSSTVLEMNADKPPHSECKNPCCLPKICKNICAPKPDEDSCKETRPPIEDVIRLVCKEVMDRGTATRKAKAGDVCLKCHQPKPKCACKIANESATGDESVDNNQTNGEETDNQESCKKDVLIEDTDGAETLSLNAVEKMCKTVGKLALQMNDLMEKLRRSVTHTKDTVADVAKKDCGCPTKKRGVKINCPNKVTNN